MMAAQEAQIRCIHAAGARVFMPTFEQRPWFHDVGNKDALDEYIRSVVDYGVPLNKGPVFSAHQMSTCRMSKDPESGVVDQTGAVWGKQGLYIADGSVLPTSLGINPMVSIETFAFLIARNVKNYVNSVEA